MKAAIRIFTLVLTLCMLLSVCAAAAATPEAQEACLTVPAGESYVVEKTMELARLEIGEGAALTAPEGYSLSLTVNGVETGQILETTTGTNTVFAPGVYVGEVVLTVAKEYTVDYSGLTFPIRAALFLDENGVAEDKSVTAAVRGLSISNGVIEDAEIYSTGEAFDGVYAIAGENTVSDAVIYLDGNGRSDMVGQGAAIYATGADTRLVIDDATVYTKGVVRTTAIANDGANLIIKNSTLVANDGVLPEDYVPSVDVAQMRGGFPIGGSIGDCRATNLLGENTKATYINSWISAEGWGTLSTDGCTTPLLTGINSIISLTGDNIGGYGAYAIGNVKHRYLGCTFNVDYDIVSIKGGYVTLGDSDKESVAALNEELDLRLTDEELADIPEQNTVVHSKRFGFVTSGSGEINIEGGTQIHTGEAFFLNMGQQSCPLNVDGSGGASITSGNGILYQLQDSDSPGPSGKPFTEPSEEPVADAAFDVTSADSAAAANFSNIALTGDFYNSIGYTKTTGKLNLALNFDACAVTGVMTSAAADHLQDELYVDENDYKLFGVLEHTPCPAVNNGVIVSLTNGSVWTVTGDSFLTSLTLDASSSIVGASMTVNGVDTPIKAGSYTGDIVLTVP